MEETKMKDLLKLITDEDIEKFIHDSGSGFTVQDIRKLLFDYAPILLLRFHLEELTVHQYAELYRVWNS